MLANVRIEQDKDKPYKHKLEVNGIDFSDSTYSVEIESESIPEVNIKMRGTIPLYTAEQAKVKFDFSPTSIQDALFILVIELQKHSDVYNGFLASIESSVREQKLCGLPFQPEHEIAEKILKRIIGEE